MRLLLVVGFITPGQRFTQNSRWDIVWLGGLLIVDVEVCGVLEDFLINVIC